MKFRFCPLCGSEKIALMNDVVTPEEDRHTEVYGCFTCKKVVMREIIGEDEKRDKILEFESIN